MHSTVETERVVFIIILLCRMAQPDEYLNFYDEATIPQFFIVL
jgi:hypothetical protein